jgi:hypothetical protein
MEATTVFHPKIKPALLNDYRVGLSPEQVWTFWRRSGSCPFLEWKNDSTVVHPVAQLVLHCATEVPANLSKVFLLEFQENLLRFLSGMFKIAFIFLEKLDLFK